MLREQLARCSEQPDGVDQVSRLLDPYRRRMNDISIFVKELKGCFAQWYNRRHGRYGTLWAERFKSLLLEEGNLAGIDVDIADLDVDELAHAHRRIEEQLRAGSSCCTSPRVLDGAEEAFQIGIAKQLRQRGALCVFSKQERAQVDQLCQQVQEAPEQQVKVAFVDQGVAGWSNAPSLGSDASAAWPSTTSGPVRI